MVRSMFPARIQNVNLTRPEARSGFRVTVVVGKPYDSSKHPAASMLLHEILGRSDWHRAQRCGEAAVGSRANS